MMAKNYCYEIPLKQWKRSPSVKLLARLRRQTSLDLAWQGFVTVHRDGTAVLTKEGRRALKWVRAEYKRRGIKIQKSWSKPR